jgi:hypothetical protein
MIPEGISFYCTGKYTAAAEYFLRALEQTEGFRLTNQSHVQIWPSDIRLWLCASLNRLGKDEEAQFILNHAATALDEDSP